MPLTPWQCHERQVPSDAEGPMPLAGRGDSTALSSNVTPELRCKQSQNGQSRDSKGSSYH